MIHDRNERYAENYHENYEISFLEVNNMRGCQVSVHKRDVVEAEWQEMLEDTPPKGSDERWIAKHAICCKPGEIHTKVMWRMNVNPSTLTFRDLRSTYPSFFCITETNSPRYPIVLSCKRGSNMRGGWMLNKVGGVVHNKISYGLNISILIVSVPRYIHERVPIG